MLGGEGIDFIAGGNEWYPIREAIVEPVDMLLDEFNESIGLQ